MQPATYNFTYYRGDTLPLTVKLYDANGQSLDVNSWTGVTFGLNKERGNYTNTVALSASLDKITSTVTCSITSGIGNVLDGSYFYDITLYKVSGSVVTEEYTVMTGTIQVIDDVVRSSDIPGVLP